jgi:ATP-dependent protease ClpP protease subunit
MPNIIKLTGTIDPWGWQRYTVQEQLNSIPENEPVILQIDSLGGEVSEAISISNILKERGNVTAQIVGFCASAATWLAYGCDKVIINDDCAYLIHKCTIPVNIYKSVNADDLDALISKLQSEKKSNDAIDLIIAQKYFNHAAGKMNLQDILNLMTEERWMLPDEALQLGFVDEISTEHVINQSNMLADMHVMNAMKLPELPESFRKQKSGKNKKLKKEKDEMRISHIVKKTLTQVFGGSIANIAPGEKPEIVKDNTIAMNKKYITVNNLLKVEGIDSQDNKIILTSEQMQVIEDSLASLNGKVENMGNIQKEKDASDAALLQANKSLDSLSDEVKEKTTIDDKIGVIKNIFNKVAGVNTEHHGQEHDKNDFSDVAKDPINAYAQNFSRKK